jgi:uncharacterized protein (DUF302 family)
MQKTYSVQHNEHITRRPFDEVIRAFDEAVGSLEGGKFGQVLAETRTPEEFEQRIKTFESTSGFMRFLTIDHGGWAPRSGMNFRAIMYTIGNPLIARTMLKHDPAAGLNVPIRLLIYEHAKSATTRIAYDLPSSLMSVLGNDEVTAAAEKLDAKLIALAVHVTGSEA